MSFKKPKLRLCSHAPIRRIQEDINHRVFEQSEDSNVEFFDRSLRAHLRYENPCETSESHSTENTYYLHGGGFSAVEITETRTGSDITLSSTDSCHGFNSPQNTSASPKWVSSITGKTLRNIVSSIHRKGQKTKSFGSSNELTNSVGEDSQSILPAENPQISSEITVEKLKGDILTLVRQAELSDLELQTLRKHVVKETKRARDLSNEVTRLKRENCSLIMDSEKYKYTKKAEDSEDPWLLIDEHCQELTKEKELNGSLKLQLKEMQDSNSGLTLAVQELEKRVEFKEENEAFDNFEKLIQTREMGGFASSCTVDDGWGEDALKDLVLGHRRAEEAHLLEQRNIDLCCEIEICRREKEEAEAQMEQLALDYEILKQENHDLCLKLEQRQTQCQLMAPRRWNFTAEVNCQLHKLENELREKSQQCCDSSITVSKLENQVKALEEEMQMRNESFEADLRTVISEKVQKEKRAILAEEALKKTRWKNANAAQRLQQEFRRLSFKIESTFSANERMMMLARSEASEQRLRQKYMEQLLEKANKDRLRERALYENKLLEHSGKLDSKVFPVEFKISEDEDHKIWEENSEQEKAPLKETDFLQRSKTVEKYELENVLVLTRGETCNTTSNHFRDQECMDLKFKLSQDDFEKEESKGQIVQVNCDLLKEDSFIRVERYMGNDEIYDVSQSSGRNAMCNVKNFLEECAPRS